MEPSPGQGGRQSTRLADQWRRPLMTQLDWSGLWRESKVRMKSGEWHFIIDTNNCFRVAVLATLTFLLFMLLNMFSAVFLKLLIQLSHVFLLQVSVATPRVITTAASLSSMIWSRHCRQWRQEQEDQETGGKPWPASSGWSGLATQTSSMTTSGLCWECCWRTWRTRREPAELWCLVSWQRCWNMTPWSPASTPSPSSSYSRCSRLTRTRRRM